MNSKNNDTYLAEWLENRLSDEDLQEFRGSESYEEYLRLRDTSKDLTLKPFNVDKGWERLAKETNYEESQVRQPARRRVLYYLSAAAAALLFMLYIGDFFTPGMESFSTPLANQESIVLMDNSSIRLNADSEVKYNAEKWTDNRSLRLQGEAFIDVPKKGPFEVLTNNGTVSVLGTSFNVYSREDRFSVECYTGIVRVELDNGNYTVLSKNEGARLKKGELDKYNLKSTVQPSWMKGESSFESQKMSVVIDEFMRQYDVKIELKRLFDEPYTGDFVHDNIDKALHQITDVMGLKYDKQKDQIVIY